jgi:hypothetical protein
MTLRRPLVRIGQEFTDPATDCRWRITDVGRRTFLAIKLTGEKPENLRGPPYSVAESVWDEYSVEALVDVKGLEWEHTRPLEDQRVLEAAGKLPIPLLQDLGMQGFKGMNTEDGQALYAFVAFELARRIVEADPDVPRHKKVAEVMEAPLQRLFAELEEAIKEGERSKTLTSDERLERLWGTASLRRPSSKPEKKGRD